MHPLASSRPRARPLVLPPPHDSFSIEHRGATERALAEGGDARIALSAAGVNQYGCAPRPDPSLIALGSSTASVISEAAFTAAHVLYARLQASPQAYLHETRRIRTEIGSLSGAAAVPGTEVVLAASGTDVHLIALHLATPDPADQVQAVMVDHRETGSGVTAALAGNHFADTTCLGDRVHPGTPLALRQTPSPLTVALRLADGSLRDADEIDAEFVDHVERSIRAGRRCLVVLTDVSKTGLLAPSIGCAKTLLRQYPGGVEVLVDACQFRLTAATIGTYLRDGFMVAITGSKFVTGPAFSGALLLPRSIAQRAGSLELGSLRPYSSRSHWPQAWPAAADLHDVRNPGLLLRWEAALTELRDFAEVPSTFVEHFLTRWGEEVRARIAADPSFESLPVAPLRRRPIAGEASWDELQTIFPFLVFRRSGCRREPLTLDEVKRLHRQLQTWHRFQLGQPVPCGARGGTPISALRICASARMICGAFREGCDAQLLAQGAALALDRIKEHVSQLA